VAIPCEPTLALPAHRGSGGRAGWVALAAMRGLPPDTALLCAASDGVDGTSGAAGAAVTSADAADPAAIEAALKAFDDAPLHRALGTSLEGAPTGHNLTDLHIVARTP
jgi:hydroxypyruvate reductase